MKTQLTVFIATMALIASTSAGAPVLTRLSNPVGAVTWNAPGETQSSEVHGSVTLKEGSVITTAAKSTVQVQPIPGAFVSLAENSRLTIVKTDFVKEGNKVKSREVRLKLEKGALLFSLQKLNPAVTKFEIETPAGIVKAKGTIGQVAVSQDGKLYQVSTQSGVVTSIPNSGQPIDVPAGALMVQQDDGTTQVINATTGKTTTYNAAGAIVSSHTTPKEEVTAVATAIKTALAQVATAVQSGAATAAAASEVQTIVAQVNTVLEQNGVPTVTVPDVIVKKAEEQQQTNNTQSPSA